MEEKKGKKRQNIKIKKIYKKNKVKKQRNPCPAEPRFIFFGNMDPDQLASDKAIWSGSSL